MSDNQSERLARFLCEERGVDPEAPAFGHAQAWRGFEGWARAILADPPILEPWQGESAYRQADRRALARLKDEGQ